MTDLHVKDHARCHRPGAPGDPAVGRLDLCGFDLWRQIRASRWTSPLGRMNGAIALISGRCDVAIAEGPIWPGVGERMEPFSALPHSIYVPWHRRLRIEASTTLELGICKAPGGGDHAPRLIPPDDVRTSTRGKATNTRYPRDILPRTSRRTRCWWWKSHPVGLLVVLPVAQTRYRQPSRGVSAGGGLYYHRFNPPQGFGFQRVYTDDRSLDVSMAIEDGD